MTYFHGGVPGLRLGDQLLPPTVTGVRAAVDFAADLPGAGAVRRDRVYLATTELMASIFAAMHPAGGWLYEVDPVGEIEPDPDWFGEPGESVEVGSAIVVRVIGPLAPEDVVRIRRVLAS